MTKRFRVAIWAAAFAVSGMCIAQSADARGSHEGGGGASRSCLTSSARNLLGRIEARFGAMQIVSTCRPGARIAGSGRISKHASGNAVDFNAGSRKGEVVRWLISNHHSGGTMTYPDSSHIHVDIGYHFVSLAGERIRTASYSKKRRSRVASL